AIVSKGRDPVPKHVRFTTWTLRYNEMLWVTVDSLARHWERARVNADIADDRTVRATTENVTALTFSMPPGSCPFDATRPPHVFLDGVELETTPVLSDRSWTAHFEKTKSGWQM